MSEMIEMPAKRYTLDLGLVWINGAFCGFVLAMIIFGVRF